MAVRRGVPPLIPIAAAAFFFCAIGFRRHRKRSFWLLIGGLALGLTVSTGCSGNADTLLATPPASIITVTATAGTVQQTAALTVTVN
jgi:hypothetical protein